MTLTKEQRERLERFVEFNSSNNPQRDLINDVRALLAAYDEAQRELTQLRMAVGLATTMHPTLEMDSEHPVEMMQAIVVHVDEARKDAERYRWLRDNICIGSGAGGYDRWSINLPDPGTGLDTDKVFDAAIDAAMDKP